MRVKIGSMAVAVTKKCKFEKSIHPDRFANSSESKYNANPF